MQQGVQVAQDVNKILAQHLAKIQIARATELALAGRYDESEAILRPGGQDPKDPLELDLLARIEGCKGRFDRARSLWAEAARLDGDNPEFRHSIRLTSQFEQRRRDLRQLAFGVVIAIFVAAAFVAALNWVLQVPPSAGSKKGNTAPNVKSSGSN